MEVYVSQGPHQGVVFGYIEGSFLVNRTGDVRERYAPNIYRCIRHKYIGHAIENWWTSGGGGVDVDRRTVGGVGRGSSGL